MNHSLYSADRVTHSKIVVAALLAAIVITGLATYTRANTSIGASETIAVIKAGKPAALTRADVVVVAR
jgi:hypothetical protein